MDRLVARPAPADGRVCAAPPGKSALLRALALLACRGAGAVHHRGTPGTDVVAMLDGLARLGARFTRSAGSITCTAPIAEGGGIVDIAVEDGAAPLRFLVALAAARGWQPRVRTGDRLAERVQDLDALATAARTGIEGAAPAAATSQAVSALLLAAAAARGPRHVRAPAPGAGVSAGYIDLTMAMMREAGIGVEPVDGGWRVAPTTAAAAPEFRVGADWSAAAVLLATAPLLGERVTVPDVDVGSPEPDRAIVAILRELGVEVATGRHGACASGALVRGGTFDLGGTPDLAPVLAALGLAAPGGITVRGAPHLRRKESDRIATTCAALRALGARAEERDDGFRVDGFSTGAPTTPPVIDAARDHRLVMMLSMAGLLRPVRIRGVECVAKSFPDFFTVFPARTEP